MELADAVTCIPRVFTASDLPLLIADTTTSAATTLRNLAATNSSLVGSTTRPFLGGAVSGGGNIWSRNLSAVVLGPPAQDNTSTKSIIPSDLVLQADAVLEEDIGVQEATTVQPEEPVRLEEVAANTTSDVDSLAILPESLRVVVEPTDETTTSLSDYMAVTTVGYANSLDFTLFSQSETNSDVELTTPSTEAATEAVGQEDATIIVNSDLATGSTGFNQESEWRTGTADWLQTMTTKEPMSVMTERTKDSTAEDSTGTSILTEDSMITLHEDQSLTSVTTIDFLVEVTKATEELGNEIEDATASEALGIDVNDSTGSGNGIEETTSASTKIAVEDDEEFFGQTPLVEDFDNLSTSSALEEVSTAPGQSREGSEDHSATPNPFGESKVSTAPGQPRVSSEDHKTTTNPLGESEVSTAQGQPRVSAEDLTTTTNPLGESEVSTAPGQPRVSAEDLTTTTNPLRELEVSTAPGQPRVGSEDQTNTTNPIGESEISKAPGTVVTEKSLGATIVEEGRLSVTEGSSILAESRNNRNVTELVSSDTTTDPSESKLIVTTKSTINLDEKTSGFADLLGPTVRSTNSIVSTETELAESKVGNSVIAKSEAHNGVTQDPTNEPMPSHTDPVLEGELDTDEAVPTAAVIEQPHQTATPASGSAQDKEEEDDSKTLSVESELHEEDVDSDNRLLAGSGSLEVREKMMLTTAAPTTALEANGRIEAATEAVSVELVTRKEEGDSALPLIQKESQEIPATALVSNLDAAPQPIDDIAAQHLVLSPEPGADRPEGRAIAGPSLSQNNPPEDRRQLIQQQPASANIFDLLSADAATNCSSGLSCDRGQVCLTRHQVCDSLPDCLDGQDEGTVAACEGTASACRPDEFPCLKGRCIPLAWKCDGRPDCGRGEDELACQAACPSGQFLCRDGRCLPNSLKCDGREDCGSGEDEVGSTEQISP